MSNLYWIEITEESQLSTISVLVYICFIYFLKITPKEPTYFYQALIDSEQNIIQSIKENSNSHYHEISNKLDILLDVNRRDNYNN